jgi:manganese/zinc/iron transport system substrate-binding protein
MRSDFRLYLIVTSCSFGIIGTCLWLLHCQKPYCNSKNPTKLTVVCTTSILADAARAIGGNHCNFTTLMGPGVEPHIYRARERDAHALASADIIFYHGLHLEGKMATILHGMEPYTKACAVADTLPSERLLRMPDAITTYDPHIWFDIPLWMEVVRTMSHIFLQKDPIHAVDYKRNTQHYLDQLQSLHTYIIQRIDTIAPAQRILVTAHDAFGYLGKTYGLTVIGLQGINTDAQASTYDIQKLVEFIINHRIPAIFVESSIPHRTLEAVQHALQVRGWHITIDPELYSDALGSPDSDAGTYIGMVKHNIDAITRGLTSTPAQHRV